MTPAPEAGDLLSALGLSSGNLVAAVGAGGKTTLLYRIAAEARGAGLRVIVTATTHMGSLPESVTGPLILAADANAELHLDRALAQEGRATLLGERLREDKIRGLAPARVDALLEQADLVLVEADGARSRSLKVPAEHEPVIPSRTSLVLVLVGLDVLGCPLGEEWVHRVELVAAAAGKPVGATVDEDVVVAALVRPSGYPGRLPAGAQASVFLNKAEADLAQAAAARIAPRLLPPYGRAIAGSARGGPVRVWG